MEVVDMTVGKLAGPAGPATPLYPGFAGGGFKGFHSLKLALARGAEEEQMDRNVSNDIDMAICGSLFQNILANKAAELTETEHDGPGQSGTYSGQAEHA